MNFKASPHKDGLKKIYKCNFYKEISNEKKELFALGMANVVGSFFRCFVSSGSLSRSIVAENSGGKTQVTKN